MHLFIAPHPPIILSEIGRGEEIKAAATIGGMERIAADIAKIKPKTIAVITPHGNAFSDALCISTEKKLQGDFGRFGNSQLHFSFSGSNKALELCDLLPTYGVNTVALDKISAKKYHISEKVDHGALVPLSFVLKEYSDFELLHIGMGFLERELLCTAGRVLSDSLNESDIIIISGDLSHRLSYSAPAGFDPEGIVYDNLIVEAIKNKRYIDILEMTEHMLAHAGQCAQRPLEMMVGALDEHDTETEVYSYEGPFGVGYMTAHITRNEKNGVSQCGQYAKKQKEKLENIRKNEDEYVLLARKTIEAFVRTGTIIERPDNLSNELYNEKHGVFVSIKKAGMLRGCIGTIEASYGCVADEIIKNAISASTRDPRFDSIAPSELDSLEISVDILFPAEHIGSIDELDPVEYGVIVNKGFRRGLLLPNLEGIDTAEEQVAIALKKAGISRDEHFNMQRFKVVRHK